jgi:hypothetical protein
MIYIYIKGHIVFYKKNHIYFEKILNFYFKFQSYVYNLINQIN